MLAKWEFTRLCWNGRERENQKREFLKKKKPQKIQINEIPFVTSELGGKLSSRVETMGTTCFLLLLLLLFFCWPHCWYQSTCIMRRLNFFVRFLKCQNATRWNFGYEKKAPCEYCAWIATVISKSIKKKQLKAHCWCCCSHYPCMGLVPFRSTCDNDPVILNALPCIHCALTAMAFSFALIDI